MIAESAQKKRKGEDKNDDNKRMALPNEVMATLRSPLRRSVKATSTTITTPATADGSSFAAQQQHSLIRSALKARLHKYFRRMKKMNDTTKEFLLLLEPKVVQRSEKNTDNQPTRVGESTSLTQCLSAYETFRHIYTRQVTFYKELYKPKVGTTLLLCGNGDCNQLGNLNLDRPASQGNSQKNSTVGKDEEQEVGTLEAKRPKEMKYLRGTSILQVACGGLHNLALRADGTVLSWGCNDDGALGRLTESGATNGTNSIVPTATADFIPDLIGNSRSMGIVVRIACGDCQSLALTLHGQVYMWGCYKDKEGKQYRDVDVISINQSEKGAKDVHWEDAVKGKHIHPVRVDFKEKRVQDIRCGYSFNAALTEDGYLYTWGFNLSGELGRPTYNLPSNARDANYKELAQQMLTPLPPLWSLENGTSKQIQRKVESVACGGFHMLVTTLAGFEFPSSELFSTGLNQYGQLGHDDTECRSALTHVKDLTGYNIYRIAAGQHHSLCTDEDGNLIAFGRGDSGQLGITDRQPTVGYYEPSPVMVTITEDNGDPVNVSQISCGGNHNLIITSKGSIYTWGYGDLHALGHGDAKDEYRPRKLNVLAGGIKPVSDVKVHQVAGGGQHSAFLCTLDEK